MRQLIGTAVCLHLACMAPAGGKLLAAETEPVVFQGRVVDPHGYPIPGAEVKALRSGKPLEARFTDDRGEFRVRLKPGRYSFRVRVPGFQTYEQAWLLGDQPQELLLRLEVDTTVQHLEVRASAPRMQHELAMGSGRIDRQESQDLAELLRGEAGTAAVRRGPINLEPNIRGLQENQIGTFVDRTRTFAAGPARMDSDMSHVSPHAVRSIRVVKGPYALGWGAGVLSGIQVQTFRPPFHSGGGRFHGRFGYRYGQNAVNQDGHGLFWGGNEWFRLHLLYNRRQGNDYRAGDGSRVPGDYSSDDVHWSLGFKLLPELVLDYAGGYQEQNDIDYPGRILDASYFYTRSNAVGLTWNPAAGALSEIRGQVYLNLKDHLMNNEEKPTARPMAGRKPPFGLLVDLPTESNTIGGDFSALIEKGLWDWRFGLDFYNSNQTATRSIFRRAPMVLLFRDVVWPDAELSDQGFYVQMVREGERTELAGTVRIDRVQAVAGAVSDFFAANTQGGLDQGETHVSAALNGRWSMGQGVSLTAGLGRAVRTATVLERYSDRFPATKFQIAAEFMGDPALNPEESLEFNLGSSLVRETTRLGLDLFHRVIDNYITVQADPSLQKRLPLSPPVVFRYINGSQARFHGAELTLEQELPPVFRFRGFLSYVWGMDELFGEPILGLPPLQGQAALELSSPDRRYWVDLSVTLVASQNRVASRRFEQATGGYAVADLRGRASLTSGWTLKAGVENLGDRLYSNHLNSPNPFTRRRIPEMGRNFYLGLEYEF